MRLLIVGCSHQNTPIAARERLAFSPSQVGAALAEFGTRFPGVEAVLLSTCNRVELYAATPNDQLPEADALGGFLAGFHEVPQAEIASYLYVYEQADAVEHLFRVAAGLESMVLGEAQILAQVKAAYQLAVDGQRAGPIVHALFQAALKAARRVAGETALQQRRVSVPSVAVADFAQQIFEGFDDKNILVIGAGQTAEETLRYLQDQGAGSVTVINRHRERAEELARQFQGTTAAWEGLWDALVAADLVISTTGASQPVVTAADFASVKRRRQQRPLLVLDLAVPRDFDSSIGQNSGVYLYSIDDLQAVCQRNREARDRELPAATRILKQETERFLGDLHHRATGPLIRRLQQGWQVPKDEELRRLFNKLPQLDDRARDEIRNAFDRLLGKLLHPPLESLRDESRQGMSSTLLDALARLFQLRD